MHVKKFRLFAGPNGSGKTTLINQISNQFDIGYLINADDIEIELKSKKYLDCSKYFSHELTQNEWVQFLNSIKTDSRFTSLNFNGLFLKENYMISNQGINSYHASVIAEFFRKELLSESDTFSFETVMSHSAKIFFLKEAKESGFKVYLYFICTQDPEINMQRVKNRVREGGHDVLAQKIEARYYRSLDLLYSAFSVSDRAFIIDNSADNRKVIIEKMEDDILIYENEVPEWIGLYLLDKL